MYYRPRLSNGKVAPLVWQIRLFFLTANWPIKSGAKWLLYERINSTAIFLIYCFISEAEIHFLVQNLGDIGLVLEGLTTYLVLLEVHLRAFNMVWNKSHFRKLLDEFFERIYIECEVAPLIYASIQRNLRPTKIVSFSYILTLFTYYMVPVFGFFHKQHLLPYKMVIHYDYTPLFIYIPTLLVCLWGGAAVISYIVAEANIIAMFILHLNGCYSLLQAELRELNATLKGSRRREAMSLEFRRHLARLFRRNVELNHFSATLQEQYSFRIFVMMGLSALHLCTLVFKAATVGASSKNITYVVWILGKVIELCVFGELGSTLFETTNHMSSAYYLSNWEDVILNSEHAKENVETMKLINIAIALNKKPFYLSGLQFFPVSLTAVISILQAAGSYFTFLYAFR